MTAVCILYTSIGGFKAVVWTDTLQFSVTLCILTSILIMGTVAGGGLSNIWNISESGNRIEFFNMNPDPTSRSTFWTVVIGDFFSWMSHICVTPHAVQRFMSIPTLKSSQRALLLSVLFTIFTKIICCFFGLIMYAKYYNCDPLSSGFIKKADQILPYYVMDVASSVPGLSGLFIAGLFSTSLSALSTYLNTLSGICYTEFILPWMDTNTSERKASNIIKILSVLLGLLSIGLIFIIARLGSVLEITLSLNGIAAGPVLGLFLLGLLFPFANRKGALWGVVVSTAVTSLMVVKTHMYIWNGDIIHVTKSLSTINCNTTLINNLKNSSNFSCKSEEPFWLYNISFHYNFLIASLIVVLVGILFSLIGNKNSGNIDLNLLAPIFQRLHKSTVVRKSYTPVEQQEMQPIESSKLSNDLHNNA